MFINQILDCLDSITKPQRKFLISLFQTMLVCHSSINFLNLARFSGSSEKTFRRHFRKSFDFARMNLQIIDQITSTALTCLAMDATFIKKSGKKTFGLGKFHNGLTARIETGLECSVISLLDLEQNASLALSCQQTPPVFDDHTTRIDFYLEQFSRSFPAVVRSPLNTVSSTALSCQAEVC